MSNCLICDMIITNENNSYEHIIPNAIGGIRKIKGFICISCNNKSGHTWDAELSSQLNGLCHFFDIKRERGSVPPREIKTSSGETFRMFSHGGLTLSQPIVDKTTADGKIYYQVKARDMREARRILKDLQKKYPKIDIEAALSKAQPETFYPEGMIEVPCQIGGVNAGRSIVKSAVALLYDSGISVSACDQALVYLRDLNASACFGYYWTTDLVISRPIGVPFHCVAISGNSSSGLLLAYVEYFGFLRSVVVLSEKYSGPDTTNCYAIDPTTGKQLDLSVDLQFSKLDLAEIFAYKHCYGESVKSAADAVLKVGLARRIESEQSHTVKEAVKYAFENCGAQRGDILTEEQVRIVARLVTEKLVPFVVNLNRPRRLPPSSNVNLDVKPEV